MILRLWALGLVLLSGLVGASAPVILKKASSNFSWSFNRLIRNYAVIGALALGGLSLVIFAPALKGGDLSVLYPMTSLTYVWISLLSLRYLGEKMNSMKWLGLLSIICGVVLISLGGMLR